MTDWKNCLLAAAVLLLSGCGGLNPVASESMAREAGSAGTFDTADAMRPGSASVIERALATSRRSPEDRARDESRHASAVLSFFGIAPGMSVIDLYSGGGYYSELLAYVVGPSGHVVAHNSPPFQQRAQREMAVRYQPGRLENVEQLLADNNDLKLPAERFDAALIILAYHDLYYVNEAEGVPPTNVPRLLGEIYRSLKPGGVLGVVDHAAVPGSPADTGASLHRIDEALVRSQLTAAGFLFEAQSEILRNPDDDRTRLPFSPDLRGRTDRFVLRFRKPW